MRKPLGLLGAALGAALLTASPAAATAPDGPVHRHGGDVRFELTGADETLVITGAGPAAVAWTYTVGGQTTSGTIDGFTGSLRIDDEGGTADVTVAALTVPGDLTVGTGDGPARVSLGWRNNLPAEVQVGGDLRLRTGDGTDSIRLAGSVTGSADVRTGGGNDSVTAGGVDPGSLPRPFAARSLSVASGDGADTVALLSGSTGGAADIDLGQGDDSLRLGAVIRFLSCSGFDAGTDLVVEGRAGSDTVTWTCGSTGRDAELRMGAGPDRLTLGEVIGPLPGGARPASVGRDLVIDTGAGDDTATVATASVGRDLVVGTGPGADRVHLGTPTNQAYPFTVGRQAAVSLGAGDDVAELQRVTLPTLDLDAAAGNDTVTLTATTVAGPARLDGGPGGADHLVVDPATTFQQPPTITRFEP